MDTFLTLMAKEPEKLKLARALSAMGLDQKHSVLERAVALERLHNLCMPYILESERLILSGPTREVKPKYKWIQGARVKA